MAQNSNIINILSTINISRENYTDPILDDKNPMDNDGDTPQSIAEENGNTEIVEYFKAQKRRRVVGSKKK